MIVSEEFYFIQNFNDMKTESMCREYNDLLEKACTKEVKRHDIILSTCIASHMKAISEVNIEQLIVDEAAMIKEPEVLVPIISCQPARVVLIGDHKQLRCITKCSQAAEMDFDRSLFERFHRNLTMLEEQYRMHPSICKFPSKAFYKAQLVTGANGPFRTPLFWPKRFQDEQEFLRMERGKGKGYDRDEFRAFRIVFLDVKGRMNYFYIDEILYLTKLNNRRFSIINKSMVRLVHVFNQQYTNKIK